MARKPGGIVAPLSDEQIPRQLVPQAAARAIYVDAAVPAENLFQPAAERSRDGARDFLRCTPAAQHVATQLKRRQSVLGAQLSDIRGGSAFEPGGVIPTSLSFQTVRVEVSAVSGSTCALARGAVRLARRLSLNRFTGEAPVKTAGAAVLPGTGRTARDSLPGQSLFAEGRWYKPDFATDIVRENLHALRGACHVLTSAGDVQPSESP